MKYDYNTLLGFCKENNIIMCDDYSNINLNRDTQINGICKTEKCDNLFTKGFRALLQPNGFCSTCAIKHGKNKAKQTNLKKYGVEFTTQSKQVKDKIKKTCLEKYGVEHISHCKEIKDKTKQTCLEKYGVEVPSQSTEIMDKMSKNAYKLKKYIFPSGKIEKIQGYEHYALNELIMNEKIHENDIITGCKNVPTIWYSDENGKKHRHYVDIFIKGQNRCIEIKSTWTAKKKIDNIFLKQKAGKELGYNYEIWIYDSKGIKVEKYE
jgi:hypothetical protein